LKYNPSESYKQWMERVRLFEYEVALQQIAKGEPADKVLAEMSKRIVQKGLHPILTALKEPKTNYNVEEERKKYEENYLKKNWLSGVRWL
jgi:glutamyl-tRNA reductase